MIYFTKYLPVEGEIKEGDKFVTPSYPEIVRDCVDSSYDFTTFKKVKLFLCSRDIQVGDTVKFQLVPNKTPWKELTVASYDKDENTIVLKDGDHLIHTNFDEYCVKVIGEVSPEAVWVTEGMEFDEEQLELCSSWGNGYDLKYLKDMENFRKIHIDAFIKIKCSQCNTFH